MFENEDIINRQLFHGSNDIYRYNKTGPGKPDNVNLALLRQFHCMEVTAVTMIGLS